MDILLIGNGFDLEHGLPTKYSDFLEFCNRVKPIYTFHSFTFHSFTVLDEYSEKQYETEWLTSWKTAPSIKSALIDACKTRTVQNSMDGKGPVIITDNKLLDELNSLTHSNSWLSYFRSRSDSLGENWIDFESEISNVIQSLDYAEKFILSGRSIIDIDEPHNSLLAKIVATTHLSLNHAPYDIHVIQNVTKHLDTALNQFIRAFEIYLAVFVNTIPIKHKSSDVEALNPDYVLSFNYSNTYERLYDQAQNVQYDFIHGKASADNTLDSCNMVLGIDEYLDGHKKQEELGFLTFKKYYQRIYKATGNAYLTWVDCLKNEYSEFVEQEKYAEQRRGYSYGKSALTMSKKLFQPSLHMHTLSIFGHSLDKTDKDILKSLICNDNVKTKIYYYQEYAHDKRTLGKLIKNLVYIMGPDELIRRTGGPHKTIEFIPQTLHE